MRCIEAFVICALAHTHCTYPRLHTPWQVAQADGKDTARYAATLSAKPTEKTLDDEVY